MRVTIDQAEKLRAIGYDKPECYYYRVWYGEGRLVVSPYYLDYNKEEMDEHEEFYTAPLVHDALQWFRDEKGIICAVERDVDWEEEHPFNGYYGGFSDEKFSNKSCGVTAAYTTHHEAESALLDALIKYEEEKK